IKVPNQDVELTEEEKQFQQANAQNAANDPFADANATAAPAGPAYFEPKDLFLIQITEDFIFDKQRSRAYWDIQSIQIIVPAELNQKVDLPAGTFKYKDLVDVFKKDPRALWFNPENDQEHRNMAHAFDLRLFSSYLVKVSNPDDAYLADIYNTNEKEGLLASYWKANEMMEYEHNLWEF
ncbi:MAG TPA: gliding motility protein GldN, partial [Cytophagales bacterium]|nr:gliding motility protein GldN [Cytophagales bacterium]